MTNPIHSVIGSAAAQAVPISSAAVTNAGAAANPQNGVQVIQAVQAAAVVSISKESKHDAPNIEKKTDAQFGSQDLNADSGDGSGAGGDDSDEESDDKPSNPATPSANKKRLDVSA